MDLENETAAEIFGLTEADEDTLQEATDKVIEETAQKIMFWRGEGMGAVCAQSKARLESTLGPVSFNKVCWRVQELIDEQTVKAGKEDRDADVHCDCGSL